MSSHHFLILDQGGHSSRAIVFNACGELLVQTAISVGTQKPQPGWVEQDPQQVVDSLVHSAHQVLEALPLKQANSLLSVGLVTQRSSLVCWDSQTGEALYPVISWQDRRAAQWLGEQRLDEDEIHHRTGLRLNPHFGASKIRWCLDNVPAVQQALSENRLVCGPLASFLIARLTGSNKPIVDPANASRTLLWNTTTQSWDRDLLERFDIPVEVLPQVVTTEYPFGEIRFSRETLPLRLVNGDQSAALFATGELRRDTAYVNAGTGAFIAARWAPGTELPGQLLWSLVHQNEHALTVVEGTVNGAATALDWAKEQVGLADLDELNQWAQREQKLPLFINGIAGLGSPYWCELESEFIGQGTAQQKMVATLESIVFLLQVNLELMQGHGFVFRQIMLTGGLSRIDSFCQKLSDLSGLSVVRPELVEASAQGAAYWLAGCPENWQCSLADTFTPDGGPLVIKTRYQRWSKALNVRLSQG